MEKEYFLTGYCRTTDQSRTVTVEIDNKTMTEVDCCYENCIHKANCTIAKEIAALLEEK